MIRVLASLSLLLALAGPAAAEVNTDALKEARNRLEAVEHMKAAGLADEEALDKAQAQFAKEASEAAGEEVATSEEADAVLARPGLLGRVLTLRNIVFFFAGTLLAIGLGWLALIYLGPLLIHLPPVGWEVLGYGAIAFGLASGLIFPVLSVWLAVPAALLLPAMFTVSCMLHGSKDGSLEQLGQMNSAINMTVLGSFALLYPSQILGFFAIMAMFSLLGFVAGPFMPLGYAIGFRKDSHIARGTLAAGILTAVYLVAHGMGKVGYPFSPFSTGVAWMGPIVYCIGILILSCYYFRERTTEDGWNQYVGANFLAAVSFFALIAFGTLLNVPVVSGIGCTFVAIFLCEKYSEIPWRKVGFAFGCVGFAGLLYGIGWFMSSYPEYFIFSR